MIIAQMTFLALFVVLTLLGVLNEVERDFFFYIVHTMALVAALFSTMIVEGRKVRDEE